MLEFCADEVAAGGFWAVDGVEWGGWARGEGRGGSMGGQGGREERWDRV